MPTADAEPGMSGGTAISAPALPSQPPGERALSVLWSFAKCLAALLPVYLAGYYGFSISVVLFGLMIYMGWKHSRLEKVMRLKSAMYLLENERVFTTEKAFRAKGDLPPWVNFPDVEKAEWLNKILQQAWPFIGQYLEKLLVETIAPAIRASSIHLQTLSFTKVNIGEKALKVVGVKAHTEHDKRQVMLDLYLSYAGDVEINVEIKKYFCKAGVKGVQLHGKLRVILEPLIGDVPLVGAITMFFIRRPKLDINWTGLTNLLDIPGLNAMSDTMIMDAIASHLVLPNRLTVPLVANLHVAQLRSPLPRGVVRIHLLEAEDLMAKDTVIKGIIDGKSDPYAVLRVGTQSFTSRHVDSNLNPQWREMYEVIVHEVPGQELEVELIHSHSFILSVCASHWFNLRDVPSGSVHLRLEWLSLLSSADRLSEVSLQHSLLVLKLIFSLPTVAVMWTKFDTLIKIWGLIYKTTCYGTNSPVWEDAFTFFIQDPRKQDIDIQVKDDDRALSLGSLTIPLTRILASPELTMDQWFQLENSGSASRIYVKIVLRVGISQALFSTHSHVSDSVVKTADNANSAGQVKLTVGYSIEESRLFITVHSCRALQACSKDGADPYVSFILLPDKKATTKRRTVTKKRDLNPEFSERFDFDFSLEESMQRRLDLSVKNSVSFMSRERELIGKVDIIV
uniref:Extended synaptotagmin 1 n=1 Tax=Sander lucioperca TaxID=283035 RepID=A0A8D0AM57_SANLU